MTTHVIERDVDGNKVKLALSQEELDAKLAARVPTVPQSISKLQAELAAGQATVSQIETFMNDPAAPWAMQRAWASATVLQRDSQMVQELAWVLSWDASQIDQLFVTAAEVVV